MFYIMNKSNKYGILESRRPLQDILDMGYNVITWEKNIIEAKETLLKLND